MDNGIRSQLIFKDYSVAYMTFERNYELPASYKEEISVSFAFEIEPSEDPGTGTVLLKCKIFDETFSDNTAPFFLSCAIKGTFDHTAGGFEDFAVNSLAILMPYLRATITSFTAQAGIPAVIIPPINVFNLVQNYQENVGVDE